MKVIIHKKSTQLHNIKSAIAFDHRYIRFIHNGKLHNTNYYALYSLSNFDCDFTSNQPTIKQITYKFFFFNNKNIKCNSIKNYIKLSKHLKRQNKLKVFL